VKVEFESRICRIEDSIFYVVGPCAAHRKEAVSYNFIDLTAHEMNDVRANAVYLSSARNSVPNERLSGLDPIPM